MRIMTQFFVPEVPTLQAFEKFFSSLYLQSLWINRIELKIGFSCKSKTIENTLHSSHVIYCVIVEKIGFQRTAVTSTSKLMFQKLWRNIKEKKNNSILYMNSIFLVHDKWNPNSWTLLLNRVVKKSSFGERDRSIEGGKYACYFS